MRRYANYHPEFYITLVYIYATCASVAANMFYFVDRFVIPMVLSHGGGDGTFAPENDKCFVPSYTCTH